MSHSLEARELASESSTWNAPSTFSVMLMSLPRWVPTPNPSVWSHQKPASRLHPLTASSAIFAHAFADRIAAGWVEIHAWCFYSSVEDALQMAVYAVQTPVQTPVHGRRIMDFAIWFLSEWNYYKAFSISSPWNSMTLRSQRLYHFIQTHNLMARRCINEDRLIRLYDSHNIHSKASM